jgi:hypothetical protein
MGTYYLRGFTIVYRLAQWEKFNRNPEAKNRERYRKAKLRISSRERVILTRNPKERRPQIPWRRNW